MPPSDGGGLVGSWFQQGPGNEGASIGKVLEEPLTWTAKQHTATASSTELLAAATNVSRTVIIAVPSDAAVDGDGKAVTVNFGAAAVAGTHFRLEPAQTLEVPSLQQVQVIRNGGSNVVLDVLSGVK